MWLSKVLLHGNIPQADKKQQPAPVYEGVIGPSQNIQLKESVAYGLCQQGERNM